MDQKEKMINLDIDLLSRTTNVRFQVLVVLTHLPQDSTPMHTIIIFDEYFTCCRIIEVFREDITLHFRYDDHE